MGSEGIILTVRERRRSNRPVTRWEMVSDTLISPKLFETIRPYINSDVTRWIGGRADQSPKGKICELTLWLFLPNKPEHVIYFKYGSESIGPPPEISRLILAAIETTNPWYEQYKAGVAKGGT